MLTLFVNNTSLDLSKDVSITLKFSSPIFNTIGDHTYPFKLPATPLNVSVLGFKHRIENATDPFQVFDASLEWNGILILKGTLRILKAQSDFYEATLYMDKGDFFYRRKLMTLQDIDYGELEWSNVNEKMAYFNDCRNYSYPERKICFPMILNKSYYETPPNPDPFFEYMNNYLGMNLIPTVAIVGFPDSFRTTLVPMLYFRHVLSLVFEKLEYSLDDSFFATDPDYNKLVIYNNVDCNGLVTGPFNYDVLKVHLGYHVPLMTINEFLSGLEVFFNIRFFVNNITKTVKIVSVDTIVKSNDFVEFSRDVSTIYTEIGDPITGFQLRMNMDSDDEFWGYMKASEESTLSRIKGAVDSVSELPPWPGAQDIDLRFVRNENRFYLMINRTWAASFIGTTSLALLSEYIYKESSKTIETSFSTLMNQTLSPFDGVVGNAMANWKETTPKLFFVQKITNQFDERVIAINYNGSKSLFFGQDHGLFPTHYQAFCDFQMNSKAVKIVKQMSLLDLNQLDFSKKYMIKANNYFLSEVQVSITNSGIKPASIKAFTCL
jgi:hypothetical protein